MVAVFYFYKQKNRLFSSFYIYFFFINFTVGYFFIRAPMAAFVGLIIFYQQSK
jgi:hypothetical protein